MIAVTCLPAAGLCHIGGGPANSGNPLLVLLPTPQWPLSGYILPCFASVQQHVIPAAGRHSILLFPDALLGALATSAAVSPEAGLASDDISQSPCQQLNDSAGDATLFKPTPS